jgi:cation transporter-like permease
MIMLLRDHRPLITFSFASMAILVFGVGMWIFGFTQAKYVESWVIFRNMGVVLMGISVVSFIAGLILNTINTRVRELMSLMRRKSQ